VAGAWIDDVVVANAGVLELALVGARGEDAFAVGHLDGAEQAAVGIADADPPRPVATPTDGAQVATGVDQGVGDAEVAQPADGNVDPVALGKGTEVEPDRRVGDRQRGAVECQVGHGRRRGDELADRRLRWGRADRRGVGVEAPQVDQPSDRRVEQAAALQRQLTRPGQHRGHGRVDVDRFARRDQVVDP
jgi:hypothetical protein